ncbi:hypothetical protein Lalb_Chr19g0136601 [Lupinus albus]|uniref:Uncharacterized protein n=1 Tax=Lupinus albus TaxID=3870 RepID=A0A6A4P2I9_LUPAL|nr:hypothetical protein Lalb_Chr19g0136601 [Lupinus albus]
MSIIKLAFLWGVILASGVFKESYAMGPVVHFPCFTDKGCEQFYGTSRNVKCINKHCHNIADAPHSPHPTPPRSPSRPTHAAPPPRSTPQKKSPPPPRPRQPTHTLAKSISKHPKIEFGHLVLQLQSVP